MVKNIQAIVLAAGKSTRFKTGNTKLLEKICGQEMILYAIKLLKQLNIPTTMIVGYKKDVIQPVVAHYTNNTVSFIEQLEQKGTGHALLCSKPIWAEDHILVMNGDMPLITETIIQELYAKHIKTQAAISFVISHITDPVNNSYGRVIKSENSIQIIEQKDFEGDPLEHCCINAGIYLINKQFLVEHILSLDQNNKSNEFYLTDLIKIASDKQYTVTTYTAPFDCIRGVNTLQELWAVEQIKRAELIKHWMEQGVHFPTAQSTHVDLDVTIGAGTFIGCGVHVSSGSVIGENCTIRAFSSIENSTIHDNTIIESHTIVKNSIIGKHAHIGPFAHVHTNSVIQDYATIGNFVEVKNSTIGTETNAKHLAYLGDACIGNEVNIGAGTITCNYDGIQKHQTIIEDNAFIGSNNTLVAPLTIKHGAFTAAGSTITTDVPEDALAIARERQTNKEKYALKIREKKQSNRFSFLGAIKTHHDITT